MNYFLITALVAIVSSSCGANIVPTTRSKVLELLHEKCNKNSEGKETFHDLEAAIEPMQECIESAISHHSSSTHLSRYNTFCDLAGNGIYYSCLENFAKKVRPCLDAEEQYFPDFVLTSINASFVEYCGEDGRRRINAVLNDLQKTTCFSRYIEIEPIHRRCIDNLVVYNNIEHDVFTIKKEDLCSDLLSFKECIIDYLKETCNEDHSDIVSLIGDPFLAAC